METKDLQIGDWVMVNTPFGVGNKHKWTKDDYSLGLSVSPIPLKAEILIHNGFSCNASGNELQLSGVNYGVLKWNVTLKLINKNDHAYEIKTDGMKTLNIFGFVSYLHELQDCLRVVGESETANNFTL